MPKIQRKTQKIFCNSADSDQIAVFGTMATGTPVYSNDVEQLQSNEAYEIGWDAATLEDKAPFMEEMNGMQYGITKQLAYNFQEGIPEYDVGTTYYVGSICKVLEEGKPVLYTSLTDENLGNNPVTDATNWERLSFGNSGSGFSLFDTKISDHILEGDNALGWALQGTYVSRAVYPDFYAKCLEEYNEATDTETINGVTVKVNSNGHKFYNISDKSAIDTWYNTYGVAWFYGIDTENERVLLPRNSWFALKGGQNEVPVVGNGMTLGLTDGVSNVGMFMGAGNNAYMLGTGTAYGKDVGTTIAEGGYLRKTTAGVTTDSTKSGLVAKTSEIVKKDEGKYLYICVGNTTVNESLVDVGNLASQINLLDSEKANVDLSNINPAGKSLVSGLGMPSNRWIDLTLGASATNYTAPANGWFYVCRYAGSTGKFLGIYNFTAGGIGMEVFPNLASNYPKVYCPARKGDQINITYTVAGGGEYDLFRFIYAEGEQ